MTTAYTKLKTIIFICWLEEDFPSTLDKLTAKVRAEKDNAFKKGKGKKSAPAPSYSTTKTEYKEESERSNERPLRKRKAGNQIDFDKSKSKLLPFLPSVMYDLSFGIKA